MKKYLQAFFIIALLLAACAPAQVAEIEPTRKPVVQEPSPEPTASQAITVVDALGRTVILPEPPQRIIITGKALIMIADAIYMFPQAAERIVALGASSQGTGNFTALIDPDYESKAILQQDAAAEQVAALRPDLIILKSYLAGTVGKPLEELKIPVVYVDFETPEQYERDLDILGAIFQDDARATQLVAFYQDKVAAIRAALENTAEKPTVLMLYHSDKDGVIAFSVPPMEWMQTRIAEMAGGEPAWASANPAGGWTKVTLEQIAAWDADQVFVISYNKNTADIVAELKNDPQWQALRATREGKLYAFPADIYSWDQPDSRWILGLTWLAARLHPEVFTNMDITREAREFYRVLYGLDNAFFEEKILPSFKGDLP